MTDSKSDIRHMELGLDDFVRMFWNVSLQCFGCHTVIFLAFDKITFSWQLQRGRNFSILSVIIILIWYKEWYSNIKYPINYLKRNGFTFLCPPGYPWRSVNSFYENKHDCVNSFAYNYLHIGAATSTYNYVHMSREHEEKENSFDNKTLRPAGNQLHLLHNYVGAAYKFMSVSCKLNITHTNK